MWGSQAGILPGWSFRLSQTGGSNVGGLEIKPMEPLSESCPISPYKAQHISPVGVSFLRPYKEVYATVTMALSRLSLCLKKEIVDWFSCRPQNDGTRTSCWVRRADRPPFSFTIPRRAHDRGRDVWLLCFAAGTESWGLEIWACSLLRQRYWGWLCPGTQPSSQVCCRLSCVRLSPDCSKPLSLITLHNKASLSGTPRE